MHILWLKTELLHPVDKGGKIRTYQMLRALRAQHEITYVTLDDGSAAEDAVARADEYCQTLIRVPIRHPEKAGPQFAIELARNIPSSLPYAVAKYRSHALRQSIVDALATHDIDVVVCDFLFPSINVPDGLGVPTVLFQHNVEAEIWRRHAEVASSSLKKLYFREQWRRMREFERHECLRFDHVIAVSEEDARDFRQGYGVERVSAIPTGVDVDYFKPSGEVNADPFEMVFTGSMDWMPNEDAMLFFIDEILPLIRTSVPRASLTIVGRNPTTRMRALSERDPLIRVTGSVPDVRPHVERASVFIVPMRIGGGTRLKIYEAMGMEVPVVSTTVGAEGLPVRPGEDTVIADTPETFAAAVTRVLTDNAFARGIANNAALRVRREFAWSSVAATFGEICDKVASKAAV